MNKNLIIAGVAILGIAGVYFLVNKYEPSTSTTTSGGESSTGGIADLIIGIKNIFGIKNTKK